MNMTMEDRLTGGCATVRTGVESRYCWIAIAKLLDHAQFEVTDCIYLRLPEADLIINMTSGYDKGVASRNWECVIDYDRQLIL